MKINSSIENLNISVAELLHRAYNAFSTGDVSSFSRMDVKILLNKFYEAGRWLYLDKINDSFAKKLFIRLYEEHNYIYNHRISYYDGINTPGLTHARIRVLTMCKENSKKDVSLKLIELGAGFGNFAWKAVIAGCEVTMVDYNFNNTSIRSKLNNIMDILPENYKDKYKVVCASFFSLPESFKTTFDLVVANNILHLYPPKNHYQFAHIIKMLLVPNGHAFIETRSIHSGNIMDVPSCATVFEENKKNNCIAPGYMYKEEWRSGGIFELGVICYQKSCKEIENLERWEIHSRYASYKTILNLGLWAIFCGITTLCSSRQGEVGVSYSVHFDIESLGNIFKVMDMQVLDSYYSTRGVYNVLPGERSDTGGRIEMEISRQDNDYLGYFIIGDAPNLHDEL